MAPTTARLFDNAEKIAQKAGNSFVTVERLLLALAMEKGAQASKFWPTPASRPRRSTLRSTTSARAAPRTLPAPRIGMTR